MATHKWVQADIEARIRQRADMVNSDFVTDAEVSQYAEAGFAEFYGRVVSQFEDLSVIMIPGTVTTANGTATYHMPPATLKVKGIRIRDDYFLAPVSSVMEIEEFTLNGRTGKPTHYWLGGCGFGGSSEYDMRIMPLPKPNGVYTLDVYYVPNIVLSDVYTNVTVTAGRLSHLAWADEYVVLTAAIKCKDKEESDCTVLMAEKKQLWEIIEKNITPLDESMPKRVIQFQQARGVNSFYQDPFDAEGDFG